MEKLEETALAINDPISVCTCVRVSCPRAISDTLSALWPMNISLAFLDICSQGAVLYALDNHLYEDAIFLAERYYAEGLCLV